MKVVMVVPSLGKPCGVAEYSKNLAGALHGEGCEVILLREIAHSSSSAGGYIVHFQFEYALYSLEDLRRFVGICRGQGLRTVATLHDFFSGHREVNEFIKGGFDRYIVLAPQVEAAFMSIGLPKGVISVIPMGCFSAEASPREQVKHGLGAGPGPNIGYFGFALPQKGILELILAVKSLRGLGYPEAECFLFASTPSYT